MCNLYSLTKGQAAIIALTRAMVDRTDNRLLGFGGSLHYCVGAALARFEAESP